ncbi:MAG: hypothetical protein QUS13_04815 [Smithella sp.]|nr:hypothetical protein [Smithella sp.]
MSRFVQNANSHGSLKDIQTLINKYPEIMNRQICDKVGRHFNIDWKSPLEKDDYAEYRDGDFLKKLEISTKIEIPLSSFWPKNGPQWDALGVAEHAVFIVEAKANIPEMVSPACSASPESKAKIQKSLSEVKDFLNVRNNIDWLNTLSAAGLNAAR